MRIDEALKTLINHYDNDSDFKCQECGINDEAVKTIIEQVRRLEAKLDEIREIHKIDPYSVGRLVERCYCEEEWPCSTIEVIERPSHE